MLGADEAHVSSTSGLQTGAAQEGVYSFAVVLEAQRMGGHLPACEDHILLLESELRTSLSPCSHYIRASDIQRSLQLN